MRDLRPIYFATLMIVALVGGIFLWSYNGEAIRSPKILQIACFTLSALSFWALTKTSNRKLKEPSGEYLEYLEKIKQFKAKAEIVVPDIDACEFRNGTYHHEVEDEDASWMAAGSSIMLREEVTKTEKVVQSSLLYYHKDGATTKKYASQAFPFDKVALQVYVMKGELKLYIDRFDRSKWFFELDKGQL